MALIPIRVDRTSKPPLGTPLRTDGHWSVQGLVGAWAFNEGAGGIIYDGVSSKTGAIYDGRWVGGMLDLPNGGGGITRNSTVTFDTPGTIDFSITPKVTVFFGCFFTAPSSVQDQILGSTPVSVLGNGGIQIAKNSGQPDKLFFGLGSDGWGFWGYVPCQLSAYHNVAMVADKHDNSLTAYIDAAPTAITSGGAGFSGMPATTGIKYLGRMSEWDNYYPSKCKNNIMLQYGCGLTSEQIVSLTANPWQIYEPETVWVEVGGTGEFSGVYAVAQPAQSQSIVSSLGFTGYSAQSQPVQSEIVNALLQFSGGTAQVQAANSAALLAALSFAGTGLQAQGSQGQSLPSSLTFAGSDEQQQPNQAVNAAASLGFSGVAAQSQAQQAQAIYQSLVGITGAVSQTQAAQIASLSAALIFGGSSAQTQAAQIEALAAVMAFAGSTSQGQTAQTEALAALLSFGGEIDQEQAIQIEALTAILAAMDITGTVEQVQARQLQAASDFVAQVHAILRVTASDPLALTISVRDPLALRVTVH